MNTTVHGNLLVINQLGVMLTGASGIGKSEISLDLLDRGHQLVCDDVIDVTCEKNTLVGHCPAIINNYLMIKHVGMIDVAQLFGANANQTSHRIDLCIELITTAPAIDDPLSPSYRTQRLLDVALTHIVLPIGSNKNIALFIETLAKQHRLKQQGNDVAETFRHLHQTSKEAS